MVECSLCRSGIELLEPMADFVLTHGQWFCGDCARMRHAVEV